MPKMATPLIAPLRAKLGQLGFDEPLSADSVGLVSSLLEALVSARARVDTLTATADQQASRLFTADQIGPPLRKEIARLVRENNKLHAAMIELREAAEARSREEAVAGSKANGRVRDLSFMCSTLHKANEDLQRENAGLREAASRSFEVNGIVLPSGHEVRWHGRKERMEAHSPIPRPVAKAGAPAADGAEDPRVMPSRLVRAAEGQLTALLGRVEAGEGQLKSLEEALDVVNAKARDRAAESARVGEQLAAALEAGPPAEARRVEQAGHEFVVSQLENTINFLNARTTALESELAGERANGARISDQERSRYVSAMSELRREKDMLAGELERASDIVHSLGRKRGPALVPFAV